MYTCMYTRKYICTCKLDMYIHIFVFSKKLIRSRRQRNEISAVGELQYFAVRSVVLQCIAVRYSVSNIASIRLKMQCSKE